VVVPEDDSCGVVIQRSLDDFAGVDGCAVDRAAKHLLEADDAVARVQKQTTEYLERKLTEPGAKALGRIARLLERPAPIERAFEMAPAELERSVQASDAGGTETIRAQKLARAGAEEGVQASPLIEERTRESVRLCVPRAGGKDDGQELGIAQKVRPLGEQALHGLLGLDCEIGHGAPSWQRAAWRKA
jgi:hypothetical protein